MAAETFTIHALVGDLLLGMGEAGEHKRAQLTKFALSALDQLGYAVPGATAKTVRLDIGPRREATVPDDLALLNRVSAQVGDWLIPLVPDDRLARLTAADVAPQADDLMAPTPQADYPDVFGGWVYPTAWGGVWRAPWGWSEGTYRYFPDERLLRFAAVLGAGQVVSIEYTPTTEDCANAPLSPLVREAVENYCLWKHNLNRKDFGSADRYQRDYKNARTFYQLQHRGVHPLTIARLSDEAAFGRTSWGGR